MSGICGALRFDGGPVEESTLRQMAQAAPHRSLDGVAFWCSGPVGLAHLSVILTPESRRERQPLVEGDLTLVADARVDNRDDLQRALTLTTKHPTDAQLILAAYRHWGVECARHIIGDYAFALWDEREKRLLLARDPMSMRALYYRMAPDSLLFATEVKQIITVPGVPVEIFEPALAAYLAGPEMPLEWSFYRGIDRLPAGHALLVEEGGHRLWRFWDIDPEHRIFYKDEREYAAHFRELFKKSVAARLRTVKPVGLMLSGGLDSMSIASMAGWLRQQKAENDHQPFFALCHAFDGFPECDERHISALVTGHFGFPAVDVPVGEAWPLINYPAHGPDRDEPMIGVYQALIELDLALAQERGAGLVMSGDRGDLLNAGWSFDYIDKLRKGRWITLYKELKADSESRQRSVMHLARQRLFWPLMVKLWPETRASLLRERVRRLLGRPEWPQKKVYEPWVRDDFARRTHLEETKRESGVPSSPIQEIGRKRRYELIFTLTHMRGMVWSERTHARFGLGFADPWSDRRLAEFVLAIPHEAVNQPRQYKRLMHSAMKGIMPEPARKQASKILPTPYYFWAFRENARETILDLIEHSLAHERGYIDKAKLLAHYDEIAAGGRPHLHFWAILTVEMWLRQYWS